MQESIAGSVPSNLTIDLFEKPFCVYMIEDGWTCQIGKRCDVWIIKVGPLSSKMIIMADCSSHELKVLGEEAIPPQTVSCSEREHSSFDGCIDLDTKGRRWEGMIRVSVPFGYGILYNEEGEKEYEGFMMDGEKVCFGTTYYPDLDQIKYKGCYYKDDRFGYGVLYDRRGVIEYEGYW